MEEGHELPPLRSGEGRNPIVRGDEAELNGGIQLIKGEPGLRRELSCLLVKEGEEGRFADAKWISWGRRRWGRRLMMREVAEAT